MKISIVGAGFAGLAAAWWAKKKGYEVEIWDPAGPGGAASGVAAGLLHMYGGVRSSRAKGVEEAFEEAEQLIAIAGEEIVICRGLLRKWRNSREEKAFRKLAKRYDDVELRDDAIWIPKAYAIDCKQYCRRLLLASGAKLKKEKVESLSSLDSDRVIVAAGHKSSSFSELSHLPLKGVKGQLLHLKRNKLQLAHALNCGGYVVPAQDSETLFAGATFEHEYENEKPTEEAYELVYKRLGPLIPKLPLIQTVAGIRCTTSDHKPVAEWIDERIGVISALGSKGLLWHALLAKRLLGSL